MAQHLRLLSAKFCNPPQPLHSVTWNFVLPQVISLHSSAALAAFFFNLVAWSRFHNSLQLLQGYWEILSPGSRTRWRVLPS